MAARIEQLAREYAERYPEVRNLLKRRVYEILRTRIAGKTFGASVVISIKKEAVGRTFRELAGELENVLYF